MQIFKFFISNDVGLSELKGEEARNVTISETTMFKIKEVKKVKKLWHMHVKTESSSSKYELEKYDSEIIYDLTKNTILVFTHSVKRRSVVRDLVNLINTNTSGKSSYREIRTTVPFAQTLTDEILNLDDDNILYNARLGGGSYEIPGLGNFDQLSSPINGGKFCWTQTTDYESCIESSTKFRPVFKIVICPGIISDDDDDSELLLWVGATQNYRCKKELPIDKWVDFYREILQNIFKFETS